MKKDGLPEIAQEIYRKLKAKFSAFYDEKGAVGRRYRRQDEAGTPYCITVDGQTLTDGTVTIRDRDTLIRLQHTVGDGWVPREIVGILHVQDAQGVELEPRVRRFMVEGNSDPKNLATEFYFSILASESRAAHAG